MTAWQMKCYGYCNRHLRYGRRVNNAIDPSLRCFGSPQIGVLAAPADNSSKQHRRRRSLSSTSSSLTNDWSSGPLHDLYYSIVGSPNQANSSIDPIQLQALRSLERLRHDLVTLGPPPPQVSTSEEASPSMLTGWFGRNSWMPPPPTSKTPRIRGVYLHGGVGCGKTFLMNQVFFESLSYDDAKAWSGERQKTHFHKFLLRVHQEMHSARQRNTSTNRSYNNGYNYRPQSALSSSLSSSPRLAVQAAAAASDAILPTVIDNIAAAGRLLCFDEFQVTDVADALILQRLFTGLWLKHGCIVVATSNRPPHDLYKDGLQRDRFLPFIDLLQDHCEEVSMWASTKDYRLVLKHRDDNVDSTLLSSSTASTTSSTAAATATAAQPAILSSNTRRRNNVYFVGKAAWKDFDALFFELAGASAIVATKLPTTSQGGSGSSRTVSIPRASKSKGLCRFTFEELCQKALGAADYLVIGRHFSTVCVEQIPLLQLQHVNWVRRFIIFVDAMYECHVKLVLHTNANVPLTEIFAPATGNRDGDGAQEAEHIDEVFAFQRTASRLHEMSSQTYLQKQRPSP